VARCVNHTYEALRVADVAILARTTKPTTPIRTAFLARAFEFTPLQDASKIWGAKLVVLTIPALAVATIVATFLSSAIGLAVFYANPAFT
jgi:hypothetical protein